MAISDLSFKLYSDEAMTTLAGSANGASRKLEITSTSTGNKDYTFYLGSTNADRQLQTASNPGTGAIMLTPGDVLTQTERETAYTAGQIVRPAAGTGYCYRVTTGGTTAANAPSYPVGIGSAVTDGTVVLKNIGKMPAPSDIKLALSAAGLDTATGGASLSIGNTLKGGSALAIYMRINITVTDVYDALSYPMLALNINEVLESNVSEETTDTTE